MDLWPVDIRRFAPSVHARRRLWCASARSRPMPSTTRWPGRMRNMRAPGRARSRALYATLAAQGRRASARSSAGSARTGSRRPASSPRTSTPTGGRTGSTPVGEEHRAARERVALFDQSSFAKFEVSGNDAEAALDWICAGDVDAAAGTRRPIRRCSTRAAASNATSPCRASREDRYFIVTGTGFRTHDLAWIRRNLPAGLTVEIVDVTEDYGCLSLMGPRARDVLAAVTSADVVECGLPLRRLPRDRDRRRDACGRCASPMSASSAASCTCRRTGSSASMRR